MQNLLEVFEIVHMNKASLTLRDKGNGEHVFMHRRAFNNLPIAENWRVTERIIDGKPSKWIEVLIWVAL
jgi:hypothetical protein